MTTDATNVRPEVLISRLCSDNQVWRVAAEAQLIALGRRAVEPLIGALRHANPAVRIHAVHALGALRDERGLAEVVRALGDAENSGAVAIAAEKALVAWGGAAVPALEQTIREGPEAVRPRAVRTLGKLADARSAPFVEGLLADASSGVRAQAGAALLAILKAEAIDQVAPLLNDPDKWVRYQTAEALLRVGCVRGERALQDAQNDPEERGTHVSFWAEDLLSELDDLKRSGRALP